MKRFLCLLLIFPSLLFGQFIVNSGSPSVTILHIEIRDYDDDQGCSGNSDGWTWYTLWGGYTLIRPDSMLHCNNDNYDDSAQSVVVGGIQYQVNCACNDANPINMFVRNYNTGELLDSLIIYSNQVGHTTHRLTLLGICKLTGTDTLLLGGLERHNHPPAITHPDTMYGIWKWVPKETTAYWCYDTEASGSFGRNGLAMSHGLVYVVSESTDTLEVIDASTWTQSSVKDMNQPGGTFRGIAVVGDTIIVSNATNKTFDYYDRTTLNYLSNRDMTDFVKDSGNILYGAWTVTGYK